MHRGEPCTSNHPYKLLKYMVHMTMWQIFHEQLLYLYHLQLVQGLVCLIFIYAKKFASGSNNVVNNPTYKAG
jgi:hypothetical protein